MYNGYTTQTQQHHIVLHVYIQYVIMIHLSDQVRLVALLIEQVSAVCIAFTGDLQKHELADYSPEIRKFLDLYFMQTSHFLVKFYTPTLYFNIFR